MDQAQLNTTANLIWGIADDFYKPAELRTLEESEC
jgi:hypothetical protein